jgi:hypothetical protein
MTLSKRIFITAERDLLFHFKSIGRDIAAQHLLVSHCRFCLMCGRTWNKSVSSPLRRHGKNEKNWQSRYSRAVFRVFSRGDRCHDFARDCHGRIFFRKHVEEIRIARSHIRNEVLNGCRSDE